MAEPIENTGDEVKKYEGDYIIVDVRTPFACLLHWLLVLSIIILSLTGIYIGDPELLFGQGEAFQTFMMAKVRFIHFITAAIFIISLILRLYLSFMPGCRRDIWDILPTYNNVKMAIQLALYFIRMKGEHAHFRYINPIGGIAIFLMILLFIVEIATGFTLYFQQADPGMWAWALTVTDKIEIYMGGMMNVRFFHHLAMWVILAMVVIHIYMQVWKDIKFPEAGIVSIIAGYKVFPYDLVMKHAERYQKRGVKH